VADTEWFIQYLYAIYVSFITMITVGYGDIVPVSRLEKMYCILMTIISCGVFAYAVNAIGTIFNNIAQKEILLKSKKYEISQYMRNRGITKHC